MREREERNSEQEAQYIVKHLDRKLMIRSAAKSRLFVLE